MRAIDTHARDFEWFLTDDGNCNEADRPTYRDHNVKSKEVVEFVTDEVKSIEEKTNASILTAEVAIGLKEETIKEGTLHAIVEVVEMKDEIEQNEEKL